MLITVFLHNYIKTYTSITVVLCTPNRETFYTFFMHLVAKNPIWRVFPNPVTYMHWHAANTSLFNFQ